MKYSDVPVGLVKSEMLKRYGECALIVDADIDVMLNIFGPKFADDFLDFIAEDTHFSFVSIGDTFCRIGYFVIVDLDIYEKLPLLEFISIVESVKNM